MIIIKVSEYLNKTDDCPYCNITYEVIKRGNVTIIEDYCKMCIEEEKKIYERLFKQ